VPLRAEELQKLKWQHQQPDAERGQRERRESGHLESRRRIDNRVREAERLHVGPGSCERHHGFTIGHERFMQRGDHPFEAPRFTPFEPSPTTSRALLAGWEWEGVAVAAVALSLPSSTGASRPDVIGWVGIRPP